MLGPALVIVTRMGFEIATFEFGFNDLPMLDENDNLLESMTSNSYNIRRQWLELKELPRPSIT